VALYNVDLDCPRCGKRHEVYGWPGGGLLIPKSPDGAGTITELYEGESCPVCWWIYLELCREFPPQVIRNPAVCTVVQDGWVGGKSGRLFLPFRGRARSWTRGLRGCCSSSWRQGGRGEGPFFSRLEP